MAYMKNAGQRPVFLNLLQIRLPRGGLLSFAHRVSGVLLVLAIPLFIYLLQLLNGGVEGFSQALSILYSTPGKIIVSLTVWILIQHSLSGIRHLMMDLGYSYDKDIARLTANIAFGLSFLLIVLTGVWIWL
ncbi:succinate dehydrogenase cytochrome b556 subunit [bacterium BMS3Bbin11]|nr:succinate dehydrogenase cytochrome b556 subunit [bacterium BMS3Abin11]GBE45663.1 succinate dehydrogenase cytochrome b556 subunit [bacterium BMS3Bbin11]HDH08885.1 succinate dehydrogenase, cytochrome b556 subunit [Gammaproteobacteria bacterium]HDZ77699.1 succinate dehydrogenase, cytochrome b556 subunit [Gammaproteobacteria bacterium]